MTALSALVLRPKSRGIVLYFCGLLLIVGMVGSLVTDMYVPSLPAMATFFAVNTSAIKLTISIYSFIKTEPHTDITALF